VAGGRLLGGRRRRQCIKKVPVSFAAPVFHFRDGAAQHDAGPRARFIDRPAVQVSLHEGIEDVSNANLAIRGRERVLVSCGVVQVPLELGERIPE
jgi:hypothetical protein